MTRVYDGATQALASREFDAVISTEVVEHLFEPKHLACFASQVLKPNVTLIVSTPHHVWLKARLSRYSINGMFITLLCAMVGT